MNFVPSTNISLYSVLRPTVRAALRNLRIADAPKCAHDFPSLSAPPSLLCVETFSAHCVQWPTTCAELSRRLPTLSDLGDPGFHAKAQGLSATQGNNPQFRVVCIPCPPTTTATSNQV